MIKPKVACDFIDSHAIADFFSINGGNIEERPEAGCLFICTLKSGC